MLGLVREPEPPVLQTATPSQPTCPLTWQNFLNDHVNAWPCPPCVRALWGFHGCAHVRIRTPSARAWLTSDDGRLSGSSGKASFCAQGGDSGAPLYAANQAFGLVGALQADPLGNCYGTLYQGIIGASNAMNVNIVPAH